MKKTEIKTWLSSAIDEVKTTGNACDIHVDEFISPNINSSEDLFYDSLMIFNKICQVAVEFDIKDLELYLHIDLKNNLNKLHGVYSNISELIESIDIGSMPEIILYKPVLPTTPPPIEFYRSIIPFKIKGIIDNKIIGFYKEYRTYEELLDNENFYRELNFIYCK